MDLGYIFGVNVKEQFLAWFHGEFAQQLPKRFPGGQGLTLVILDPEYRQAAFDSWDEPFLWEMLTCFIGPEHEHLGYGGTLENVKGKLRFVLRTGGKASLEAEAGRAFTHLVLPGDFPWQGAGPYKGYIGGVSGLKKHEDWAVFKACVDKLIKLQDAVKRAAIIHAEQLRNDPEQSADVLYAAKYLRDINVSDLFPATQPVDAGTGDITA